VADEEATLEQLEADRQSSPPESDDADSFIGLTDEQLSPPEADSTTLTQADGTAKPEDTGKVETSPKGTEPAKGETAASPADEPAPWDKDRQGRDQTAANERKGVEKEIAELKELVQGLHGEIQALRKPSAKEDEKVSIDDLEAQLAKLEDDYPDDEFDDEAKAKHRTRLKAVRTELGKLAKNLKESSQRPAKEAEPSAEAGPTAQRPKPGSATVADFNAALVAADKEFGVHLRSEAVAEFKKLCEAREWINNPPTKGQMQDAVERTYAVLALKRPRGPSGRESGNGNPPPGGRASASSSTRRVSTGMPATLDQLVAERKRALRVK